MLLREKWWKGAELGDDVEGQKTRRGSGKRDEIQTLLSVTAAFERCACCDFPLL